MPIDESEYTHTTTLEREPKIARVGLSMWGRHIESEREKLDGPHRDSICTSRNLDAPTCTAQAFNGTVDQMLSLPVVYPSHWATSAARKKRRIELSKQKKNEDVGLGNTKSPSQETQELVSSRAQSELKSKNPLSWFR